MGDGKYSIKNLLLKKQEQFIKDGRDTILKIDDPRIKEKLAHQKLTLQSVLPAGEKVFLLDNANLSSGGDSLDVTKDVHPEFREIAIKLTTDMGLRLSGVDLMIEGDIREQPNKYFVLEINSAPGLDHYFQTGKKQQAIVERMYLQILRSMERGWLISKAQWPIINELSNEMKILKWFQNVSRTQSADGVTMKIKRSASIRAIVSDHI